MDNQKITIEEALEMEITRGNCLTCPRKYYSKHSGFMSCDVTEEIIGTGKEYCALTNELTLNKMDNDIKRFKKLGEKRIKFHLRESNDFSREELTEFTLLGKKLEDNGIYYKFDDDKKEYVLSDVKTDLFKNIKDYI